MISAFIFHDESGTKEEKSHYVNLKVKIRDMLRDDFTRKVVSKIVLDLRKDVSGSAQDRLFELFQDLDLHKESYKKLKSWRWERVATGIKELTQMEVNQSYQQISKFVNDRRGTIRKQAEIGVVALHPEGVNHFLDTTRHKISEWQQLKLMEVLSNKTDFRPPSFKVWLTSTNKFVVLFALRLIKYYAQNDAKASIIELVKHENNQIKAGAIDCIRAFNILEALPTLKKIFWGSSTDIKIAILDTIGILGSVNDFVFLNSIENKEHDYAVTNKALSAINVIKPGSILPTKGITNIQNIQVPEDIVLNKHGELFIDQDEEKLVAKSKEEQLSENSGLHPNHVLDELESEELKNDIKEEPLEEAFSMDFIPLVVETEPYQQHTDKLETMHKPLNNIDVVFEEVLDRYSPKEFTGKNTNINNIEVIASDLDFLPIVVTNQVKEGTPSEDINSITVNFEEVGPSSIAKAATDITDVNELSVHYEIVKGISEEAKLELNDIQVVFEEVLSYEIEISNDFKDHLSKTFDFEVIFDNGQPPLRIPKVESSELFNIEVEVEEIDTSYTSLAEIPVIGEIVTGRETIEVEETQELPLWLLNEIAQENSNYKQDDSLKMEGPEWEAKESKMMAKIHSYFKRIPKSAYHDNEVTQMDQLLNDLALFGDEREIPLLQELMEEENRITNKERIDALMKRFIGNDAYGSAPEGSSPYSVFEELFRNCDKESKLVLLDEIVLIGDEKEIHFLEQLISDPNQEISKKAKRSLELLKERSERVESGEEKRDADEYERFLNMMELMPPKESSIFDIDFEVSLEKEEKLKTKKESTKKVGGFTSFISDLLNRLTN